MLEVIPKLNSIKCYWYDDHKVSCHEQIVCGAVNRCFDIKHCQYIRKRWLHGLTALQKKALETELLLGDYAHQINQWSERPGQLLVAEINLSS